MVVAVRRIEPADLVWAEQLINRFHADRLSAQQREQHGFVQGEWSRQKIARLSGGTGVYLAEIRAERAGLAITSGPGMAQGGPAGALNELARAAYGAGDYFLYGPVVVDDAFRGQGVLRALFEHLRAALRPTYAVGVAFVEDSNPTSLAVHHRLGMQDFATYTVGERQYHALSFGTTGQASEHARA